MAFFLLLIVYCFHYKRSFVSELTAAFHSFVNMYNAIRFWKNLMDSETSQVHCPCVSVFAHDIITMALLWKHSLSSFSPTAEKQMTHMQMKTHSDSKHKYKLYKPLYESRPSNHFSSKLNMIPLTTADL